MIYPQALGLANMTVYGAAWRLVGALSKYATPTPNITPLR